MEAWVCTNCGHPHPITPTLEEMNLTFVKWDVVKATCEGCGSFTLSRSWTDDFTAGEFLVVMTRNKIQGKGGATNEQRTAVLPEGR
jgi:hypothetical protein